MVNMNGKEKIPYNHYGTSHTFAGLYNEIGCLKLTSSSTDMINHIHHRQLVLLENFEISRYLKDEDILNSDANNNIGFHRVSKDMNSPSNNNSSLINLVNF
jgi:putative SOS response-associated peptidase YedK